jgi:hypothetical protein
MRPAFISILILASVATSVSAQRGQLEYAIGLRAGNGLGLTCQYFHTNKKVMEAFVMSGANGTNLTSMYQIHQGIYGLKGVKWYLGAGAHSTIFADKRNIPDYYRTYNRSNYLFGFDGIVGLEYFMPAIPLQFTVDWKPEYNFVDARRFYFFNGALSVRYRL